jgi:riboflavin biosynthesis pyrimidine reductase
VTGIAVIPGGTLNFGSRTLWHDLLVAGLVDELHLMLGPVVLGDGTPASERTPGRRCS